MPIYNGEPWLREALDSLSAQTYSHGETLLVDDGSPDNCGAIIEEYAAGDSRLHPLHQANAGVSAARNTGMRGWLKQIPAIPGLTQWKDPERVE